MKLWFLFLQSLAVAICTAAPITFKCINEVGRPIADLLVDLDKRTMKWAGFSYTMRSVTEGYLSAYQEIDEAQVGGGFWIINRMTGGFTRIDVYFLFPTSEAPATSPKTKTQGAGLTLTTSTYRGTCTRPLP